MALPVLNAPTHELTLTSTGETIKFRPFLVKEEKILLMALESGNEDDMLNAMKQIITNCIIGEIDLEKIPLFDIQYIFLKLRGHSVGEKIQLRFKHPEDTNSKGDKCEHVTDIEIDLSTIKPEKLEGHTQKIDLTSEIGVTMSYPTIDMFQKFSQFQEDQSVAIESIFGIMVTHIDMIYQGEDVFYKDEHSEEELHDFLNSLTSEQFEKIRNFFQTMPYLRHEFDFTCDACGCSEHVELNGLEDFFA